jgi:hypothetical protein
VISSYSIDGFASGYEEFAGNFEKFRSVEIAPNFSFCDSNRSNTMRFCNSFTAQTFNDKISILITFGCFKDFFEGKDGYG